MIAAEQAREDLWEGSVRRDKERRRRENRAAWFAFFSRMAQAHAGIAKDYERRAEELCTDERIRP